jgi:hypothetical protein
MGAATQVWCATGPALAGKCGVYCEDSDISVLLQPREGESVPGDTLGVGDVYLTPSTPRRRRSCGRSARN